MFILDTNVFIEAANRYYAIDVAPGFWHSLEAEAKKGRVLTIDRVADEINREDSLKTWFEAYFKNFVKSSADPAVAKEFGAMMTWVNNNQQFMAAAKAEFAVKADGWIIAYAKANNLTLVTHEVFDANIRKKVPIPNVCNVFDVKHINTFDMLRQLGVKLTV